MALIPGTRLGPYEIVSLIGAGGMGEVFKARDTRLDRIVAVKVMPKHIAAREDLRARFEREARTVSSLNHPNICVLHEIGKQDGIDFMVLEYLEGETLAARIARGRLPIDQALKYAMQIADALDRSHRKGVVHRDVKPANIMITREGLKVLDFGLAKSAVSKARVDDATMTIALTEEGAVVGTPQYMAPELYNGVDADLHADIFGFGCVLYEMVTGKRAFDGKTRVSLVASVIGAEPQSMSSIVPMIPTALEQLVKSCLAKDPAERWQSLWDVRLELRSISEHGAETPAQSSSLPHSKLPPAVTAIGIVVAAGLAFVHFRQTPLETPVLRSTILPPENTTFDFTNGLGLPALSPDGKRIVFGARDADGKKPLWVRSLDGMTAQPLAGTDGATFPFWSPDSRYIGFFADGKLRKIDAAGGPVVALADAVNARGGSWSSEGVIVFSPLAVTGGGLERVPASGGSATRLTATGRLPWFLPDGRHFLYQSGGAGSGGPASISVGSLDGSPDTTLGEASSNAIYSQGRLLYLRDGTLMARPFDAARLAFTGEEAPLAEQVQSVLNSRTAGSFSASANGLVAYRAGDGAGTGTLTWIDRTGKLGTSVGGPASFYNAYEGAFQFSPDRTSVAAALIDRGYVGIWTLDVSHGIPARLTTDTATDTSPVWSPDGRSIAFSSKRGGISIFTGDRPTARARTNSSIRMFWTRCPQAGRRMVSFFSIGHWVSKNRGRHLGAAAHAGQTGCPAQTDADYTNTIYRTAGAVSRRMGSG